MITNTYRIAVTTSSKLPGGWQILETTFDDYSSASAAADAVADAFELTGSPEGVTVLTPGEEI